MRNLDKIDRQIVELLQSNGRMPISELANQVSLSATPCAERLRRLERDRVILGYHARINPQALGLNLLVFLELRLTAKSGEAFDRVRHELLQVPEIMECHLVSGDYDYLIKARLTEMSEYRHLLGTILKKLPASAESRSYMVMEEIKETLALKLPPA